VQSVDVVDLAVKETLDMGAGHRYLVMLFNIVKDVPLITILLRVFLLRTDFWDFSNKPDESGSYKEDG